MPNFAYTNDGAAYTYQGTGTVMGSGSQTAYGYMPHVAGGAHWGVIGWVLLAVAGLVAIDKMGFKFMVTAGKR